MHIKLTSQQEATLDSLVEAGVFPSKEAALAFSVDRLSEDADKLVALRASIQAGIEDADNGRGHSLAEVIEILRRDHEARFGPQDWSG